MDRARGREDAAGAASGPSAPGDDSASADGGPQCSSADDGSLEEFTAQERDEQAFRARYSVPGADTGPGARSGASFGNPNSAGSSPVRHSVENYPSGNSAAASVGASVGGAYAVPDAGRRRLHDLRGVG